MQLTPRTWFTFFLLALVMGLNNIYSTLLTGWGEGGSIVAVILALLFLEKSERNIINYNLGQTMASAGGSVGFSVAILASIYYLHSEQGKPWNPPLLDLSILVMSLSLMGVALAVPLRRFVVQWFFPASVACATILRAVTSSNLNQRVKAGRIMGLSGLFSAALTLPTKVAISPGASALFGSIFLTPKLALSVDPLLYGIGVVIGHRIGLSMLLGALVNVMMIEPQFGETQSENYARWIAVGLMTLPAFTSTLFALLFKSKQVQPPGFFPNNQKRDALTPLQLIGVIFLFVSAMGLAGFEMERIFHLDWYFVVLGALLSGPMCFALGKVASETGINPVRLLAITLLVFFSIFERHTATKLLAIGISGATFAAVAVDLFYDLRTGYLIRAQPKQQMVMQFLGVIPVSFAAVYFLDFLAKKFGIGEKGYFPAPGAVIWATMAEGFALGGDGIPSQVWPALGLASVIGILMTLLENWRTTRLFAPSTFALGIALLLPFEMSAAICLGSLIRLIAIVFAKAKGKKLAQQVEEDAFKVGSAVFAASSITGIVAIILISLGIFYLPKS